MMVLLILLLYATTYAIAFKDDFPTILVWRTYIFFGFVLILKNIGLVVRVIMDSLI